MKHTFVLWLFILASSVCATDSGVLSNHDQDLMSLGADLVLIADDLERSAKDTIKLSNSERNNIIALRQQLSELDQSETAKANLQQQLQSNIEKIQALQSAGPLIRQQAEIVRLQAIQQLTQGMQQRYAEWIMHPGPIVISSGGQTRKDGTMAHNTPIMSAKPAMQSMQQVPETMRSSDMSLELADSMSQQVPDEIDTSSFALSRERNYFVHIEVESDGNTNNSGMLLNEIHSWRLILSEINGKPVNAAKVVFKGHMPGHVHGLPTQPLLTDELAPGVYRLSGIKFQMLGWWVIDLDIEAGVGETSVIDTVRFNLSL